MAADRFRGGILALAVAGVLLGGWTTWFTLARVPLYEVSGTARVEADRAAHPVQAPMDGRLVQTTLTLGRRVQAGEVLAHVEAESEKWQWREQSARVDALRQQAGLLQQQIVLAEQGLS